MLPFCWQHWILVQRREGGGEEWEANDFSIRTVVIDRIEEWWSIFLLQSVLAIQLPVLQLQPIARDVVDREHSTDTHQRRLRQSKERHRRRTANIPETHVIWPSLHGRTKTSGSVLWISCKCELGSGAGGRCSSAASAIPCNDLRRFLILLVIQPETWINHYESTGAYSTATPTLAVAPRTRNLSASASLSASKCHANFESNESFVWSGFNLELSASKLITSIHFHLPRPIGKSSGTQKEAYHYCESPFYHVQLNNKNHNNAAAQKAESRERQRIIRSF